ncbi:MAG: hypothetical protein WAT39_11115 [Planctomycetota bacterium]
MANRFELVLERDKFTFYLRTSDGLTLLTGLGSTSRIMTQNEIAHVRESLRDPTHLVPHRGADGSHFVTVKDKDGSVLAKSPHVGSAALLDELTQRILSLAPSAMMVDTTKRAASAH